MSKQWFDAHNIEHCKAYRHLQHIGSWPDGFELHDVELAGHMWQVSLMGKMAAAWIDQMLERAENNESNAQSMGSVLRQAMEAEKNG